MVRAYIGVERCRAYAHERKLTVQMLPELRTDLFGKNENRKFYTVRPMPLIPFASNQHVGSDTDDAVILLDFPLVTRCIANMHPLSLHSQVNKFIPCPPLSTGDRHGAVSSNGIRRVSIMILCGKPAKIRDRPVVGALV